MAKVIRKVSDRVEVIQDDGEVYVRYTRNGFQWHTLLPSSHLHCLELVDAILEVSKMLYLKETTR